MMMQRHTHSNIASYNTHSQLTNKICLQVRTTTLFPGKLLDATSSGQKEPESSQVMHAHPSPFYKELIVT